MLVIKLSRKAVPCGFPAVISGARRGVYGLNALGVNIQVVSLYLRALRVAHLHPGNKRIGGLFRLHR